ncbi:MAG: LysR family transcriptional regulator [Verrucomicrobiota bacterium]|jgi:LysR family hydrogen peroxide-inducible transcriptional activator|nr:MAG: LysR family transcriptional regulator [Verrucomicrobiota bacterium]
MELQQLRYFSSVADLANFTRAAEHCNVSQPSLSQQIINLEKELGHKLFHRLGRKAVLTEAGTTFLDRTRKILFEIDNASRELTDSPSLGRLINVGAIQTLAPYILPEVIEICRDRYPNLHIIIQEDFRTALVNGVLEGELDLALVSLPVKDDIRLDVQPIMKEPLLLVVGKNHRLATKTKVTAADLIDETFVMMGTASSLTQQVKSFCGDHHFEPKITHRCSQVPTVKALVARGVGVSVLPQITKAPSDDSSLVYITLADEKPYRELAVIRHMQRFQSRGVALFMTILKEYITKQQK